VTEPDFKNGLVSLPLPERRRPDRAEYDNPYLIALLRGQISKDDVDPQLPEPLKDTLDATTGLKGGLLVSIAIQCIIAGFAYWILLG
jgi:hypothetical protein